MALPHYSRVIKGKAINQGAEYGSRLRGGEGSGKSGDETEDLLELLLDIMVSGLVELEIVHFLLFTDFNIPPSLTLISPPRFSVHSQAPNLQSRPPD